ncbi:MAG: hypothetical protein ACM3NH_02000 [Candidatus Saccharibacteria bacterium]
MALARLDPAIRLHVDELLQDNPLEILLLEEMIRGEVRVLELRATITGENDIGLIKRIEGMRMMLEVLKRQWIEDAVKPFRIEEQGEEEFRES